MLDNCEHLIGACAKTAEPILRRCPRVHLLATSREPLGIGGETIYRVPSLSLPGPGDTGSRRPGPPMRSRCSSSGREAQGVGLPLDEETAPLVVSICRRLDGMPLAIELAAARLRSMSLASLHDRLDQRFRLLTGGSRTALERQQTLRATVDWSYSLLTGAEQLLLRRLSVFAESFDLDAAEAVCGFGDIEVLDVADLLGSLVDKSLVVAEPAGGALRYRLLETIRQFAAERLAEAGEDEAAALAAAHCAHFLAVAEAAAPHLTGPDQGRVARAAGRRAGEPAARRRARGRRPGWDRAGPALRRRAAALLDGALPERGSPRAARAGAAAARRPRGPRAVRRGTGHAPSIAAHATDIRHGPAAWGAGGGVRPPARRRPAAHRLSRGAAAPRATSAGEPETGLPLGQEAVERARRLGDDVLLGGSLMAYLLCSDLIDPARSGSCSPRPSPAPGDPATSS